MPSPSWRGRSRACSSTPPPRPTQHSRRRRWPWRNIDTATSIDLVPLFHPFASGGQSLMDVTIEVAALVGLALFFVQIVLSALRAEPGGFAPLMALKMVHFAGEGVQHMHAQAAAARTQAQAVAATPQKVHGLAARMSWASGNGSGPKRPDTGDTAGMRQQRTPLLASAQAMNGRPSNPGTSITGVDPPAQVANAPRASAAERTKPPDTGD